MVIFVSLNLTDILYFPNLAEFRDTAALTYAEFEFSTVYECLMDEDV